MASKRLVEYLANETQALKETGLYKEERLICSSQSATITLQDGTQVLNFCANNYLGLANHPDLVKAASDAMTQYGYGMASVRFICGTLDLHKQLEQEISQFLRTEDTILYSSCFDANGGLFETILGEEDAIISDTLNHASIIDGVRLSKAKRFRYANNNMKELEEHLKATQSSRFRLIATDGVFSMDGVIANLPEICDLADKYDAIIMVDDSHAVGFVGANGRGTPEYCGIEDRIDIITGTLGKALGGASGGYTTGKKEIITWLRQRSRPYLFSNTLAPMIAGATLTVLEKIRKSNTSRKQLQENAALFRSLMADAGFKLLGAGHPIIPVLIEDAKKAGDMARDMLAEGVYVVGFSFPVVPKGQARIRTQMSASHTIDDIQNAVRAFVKTGKKHEVI